MSDNIMLTGIVGSDPKSLTTAEGLAITSFRLASSQRRFDRAQDKWIDGETNWYTVTTFRQLAANAAVSINKGERVVVSGRLKVREWESNGKKGINVDIEADALGHDLSWGTASFSRGAGLTTTDAAATTAAQAFPTAAELEAIVGGQPAPESVALDSSGLVEGRNANVETPF
jgi:single-strand DNA-binding protein